MKRILTLSYDDYANLAFDHTRALQAAGYDALSLKLRPHAFNYTEQAGIVTPADMQQACLRADIILIYHSSLHVLGIIKSFLEQRKHIFAPLIGVFHSGTTYREQPIEIYQAFSNGGAGVQLTDQCEFLLENTSLVYVAAAVDHRFIRSQGTFPELGHQYCIGHYPSKPEVKGTDIIRRMIAEHGSRFKFLYSEHRVAHREQLRRMSQCDIYLELFQNELGGRPYGCWGVTAFEAAALGRIVITQNINLPAYINAYGDICPVMIANTEQALQQHLDALSSMGEGKIRALQQRHYQWLTTYHGFEPTGKYLGRILTEL